MERSTPSADRSNLREDFPTNEAYASGVSWAAVIAGAFVAAALWLILLALGVGIGLSSVSPWSNNGASASGIGAAAIIWMIVVQFIASSMGGYLAGRLRTKCVLCCSMIRNRYIALEAILLLADALRERRTTA